MEEGRAVAVRAAHAQDGQRGWWAGRRERGRRGGETPRSVLHLNGLEVSASCATESASQRPWSVPYAKRDCPGTNCC